MLRPRTGIAVAGWFAIAACSTPGTSYHHEAAEFPISQVLAEPMRVRYPDATPANPWAGAGGEDFESKPRPDGKFDCTPVDVLYPPARLTAIRECLQSVHATPPKPGEEAMSWRYALKRTARPAWQWVEDERTPACVRKHLSELPVPREVFFLQRDERDVRECWNARIPLEADKVLDVTLPKAMLELAIRIPLETMPMNDAETLRLMTAWSLTPFFWTRDDGRLYAKRGTRAVCQACFGDKLIFEPKPSIAPAKTWP